MNASLAALALTDVQFPLSLKATESTLSMLILASTAALVLILALLELHRHNSVNELSR